MSRRGPVHSAPYGQACVHCFKSKCRCIARPDGHGCERCHRLSKDCLPSESVRKQHALKNQNSNARITNLEEKLDGLVSILQCAARSSDPSAAIRGVLDEEFVADRRQPSHQNAPVEFQLTPAISSSDSNADFSTAIDDDRDAFPSAAAPHPALSHPPDSDASWNADPPLPEPSADEAKVSLDYFRSRMLHYCPFIDIPPDQTAQQLRQERPFLFRAIMTSVSPTTQQRRARGNELKQLLAQSAVVENQSNVDLLLGLLTHIAWSYDQFINRAGILSRLMMLAMSLVYDLRLNKPVPDDVHMIGSYTSDFSGCQTDPNEDMNDASLEWQRAVLGCFLLSSQVSSYYTQIDMMRWTPRMERFLRIIGANKQCPTDAVLACQVRLHLLTQRAIEIREQQEMDSHNLPSGESPAAAFLYLKGLHNQLRELRGSISSELQRPDILRIHTHYIELFLSEAAHTSNLSTPVLHASVATSGVGVPGFARLESWWRSLSAIKSWLDIFFTIPPSEYMGLGFLYWTQLSHCIVVLYRLSTHDDPAWDRHAVRNTVDLLRSLDQIAERAMIASRDTGEQSDEDLFRQVFRMFQGFRSWMGVKIAPEEVENEPTWPSNPASMGPYSSFANPNDLPQMPAPEFGNGLTFTDYFDRS